MQQIEIICSSIVARLNELAESGYQPTDILKQANSFRYFDDGLLIKDFLAVQFERFKTDGYAIDAVWREQIEANEISFWWDRKAAYIPQLAEVLHARPEDMLDRLARVLNLLRVLSPMKALRPPPSAWGKTHGQSASSVKADRRQADAKDLERIRNLLRKAESTQFPEEAEALTAKAQELMSKFSIDQAMLNASNVEFGEMHPEGRRIYIEDPYFDGKMSLVNEVAHANNCEMSYSKQGGFVTVVGFESDLVLVELLFTSLLLQSTSAMLAAGSQVDEYGRSITRAFRRSFLIAYAHRVGERLKAARKVVVEEQDAHTSGSLLPVLHSQKQAVDRAFEELFPNLTTSSRSGSINLRGWEAGRAAGSSAILDIRSRVRSRGAQVPRGIGK